MPPLPTLERAEWTSPSWDALVREHADRVYRLAYRLSGNRVDAEDLTQETFVRVFHALPNFRPGTFEGWLRPRPDPTRRTSNGTSMPISSRPSTAYPSPSAPRLCCTTWTSCPIRKSPS